MKTNHLITNLEVKLPVVKLWKPPPPLEMAPVGTLMNFCGRQWKRKNIGKDGADTMCKALRFFFESKNFTKRMHKLTKTQFLLGLTCKKQRKKQFLLGLTSKLRFGSTWKINESQTRHAALGRQNTRETPWLVCRDKALEGHDSRAFRNIYQKNPSLRIQSPCQMMIGVYNHLLSKVFRFCYHSQNWWKTSG